MKKTIKSQQSVRKLQPTIVGSGLLALDVVVSDSSHSKAQYFAGGTCGNVLTILSYLGWDAKPISRLKDDIPSEWLVDDLSKWGVDCSLVTRTEDGSTPVIIQSIRESDSGERTHSFSLRCPCCGAYLPGYKPILGTAADEYSLSLGSRQVFFFRSRITRHTQFGTCERRVGRARRVRAFRSRRAATLSRSLVDFSCCQVFKRPIAGHSRSALG